MAVQVWIGEKPENPNERRAIVALANGLDRLEGLYLLLANFNVGGRTIDLVILKQDAIFIIELKHCDGKIFGGVNGPWYIESDNGNRKRLNPGRKNPYNQVVSYYYSFINFLNEKRADFLSAHKAESINFRTCKRVIVIAPTLEKGSEVELDWKVDIRGLDELPTYLVTERSSEIELTDEEILKIPRLLRCTRWKEINDLLEGVMPGWATVPADIPPAAPAPPPVAVAPPPAPPAPVTPNPWQGLRTSLHTAAGRLALVTSLMTIVLLVLLASRPTRVVFAPMDQPAVSLINATAGPAGGMAGGILVAGDMQPSGCVWSGFQPVGKRWDASAQQWINVGIDWTAPDLAPEVVVTLEQVAYCGNQIVLAWSVHNSSSSPVVFPLSRNNIEIRDTLGNSYAVADSKSQPAEIRVEPGATDRGKAIVSRPVSQNAPSLLVRLKAQPFGEASWLVSLEGNG